MKILHSVIATNDVITLADGRREIIADEALEDNARQVNERGLPTLLEHDWLRPMGWVHKAWTERTGNSLRLMTESVVPENDSEWDDVRQKHYDFVFEWTKKRTTPFQDFARSLEIPDLTLAIDTDCVFLQAPNLAVELFPSVFSNMDKDGLVCIEKSTIDKNGNLRIDDFLLTASPFFRPSFGLPNPPNKELLSVLGELAKETNSNEVRIAIDKDRLGIAESFAPMEQRDYWWGPKYKGNPFDQPFGMTVHGPTRYDTLNGLDRTEFWWYGKTERTFEIEELINLQRCLNTNQHYYGARFVHSIFDQSATAKHLDGAVRLYSEDLWLKRTGMKLSEFGKKAKRVKLWRIDGRLEIERWYQLIHMFFRGNYTIAEYFGFPDPAAYRSQFEASLKKTKDA